MPASLIVKCSPHHSLLTLHRDPGISLDFPAHTGTCKIGSRRLHPFVPYVRCRVNWCLQGCSGTWFNHRRSYGISLWDYMDILDYEGVSLLTRNTILDININNLNRIRIKVTDDFCIVGKWFFAKMGLEMAFIFILGRLSSRFCFSISLARWFYSGWDLLHWEGLHSLFIVTCCGVERGLHW